MAANGQRFPRRKGVATLVARAMVSSQTLRVTLRCEGFGDDWPIQQPGEIVTLLFPPGEPVVLPVAGWTFPQGAPPQEWRNYTVRRHRPEAAEIDVDVVLHDSPGPPPAGPRRRRSAARSATRGRAWTSRRAPASTGCCCAATRPRCRRSPRSSSSRRRRAS